MSAKRGRSTRTSSHARNTTLQTEPPAAPTCADVEKVAPTLMRAFAALGSHNVRASLATGLLSHGAHAEEQLDTPACEDFASAIVAAILQARMRDPFAHLPNDVVQVMLGFFSPLTIVLMRRVCKRWYDACNMALSRVPCINLANVIGDGADEYSRKERIAYAVHFVASRCRAVETLRVMVGKHGFSEQDVVMLMMANPNVKALMMCPSYLKRGLYANPKLDVMALRGMRPCCSELRVLVIEFPLADDDYMLLAQMVPQLSALQVYAAQVANIGQLPLLTTAGLVSFISKAPQIRILETAYAARLNDRPNCSEVNTNLHHLWITDLKIDAVSLDVILKCVGGQLRSLVVRQEAVQDPTILECIRTNCPMIQCVSVDIRHGSVTDQLARTVAQMRDLRVLTTRRLDGAERSLLLSRMPQGHTLKLYADEDYDDDLPELRFECVVREENIPVDLTPCAGAFYGEQPDA